MVAVQDVDEWYQRVKIVGFFMMNLIAVKRVGATQGHAVICSNVTKTARLEWGELLPPPYSISLTFPVSAFRSLLVLPFPNYIASFAELVPLLIHVCH